jgi:hypothetical protein
MCPVVSQPKMELIANVLYLPEARLSTSKLEIPVVKMKHDISTVPPSLGISLTLYLRRFL